MKITVLQHVSFEGPAAITRWAAKKGIELETIPLYAASSLPDIRSVEGLLLLGGPMSTSDDDRFPWLTGEIDFIRTALERDIPMLGVCLGAQLIAAAAGARVFPMGFQEIGWWEVESDDGRFAAFHWHGDQFELPAGAVRLYRSAACPEQGFRIGDRVTALQFHLEMNAQAVETMIRNCGDELERNRDSRWVQSADEIGAKSAPGIAETSPRLNRLLDRVYAPRQANSST